MKAKKPFYVSLNLAELTILMERASFQEIAMYLLLKKLANFKTGRVGDFRNQKLTYERLARDLSRPASQGKAEELIDRSQASRLVQSLAKRGLLCDVRSEAGALKLRLPLSPIADVEDSEEEATFHALIGEGYAGKLPQAEGQQTSGNGGPFGEYDDWDVELSVMMDDINNHQSSINTDHTADNAEGEGHPSPSTAMGGFHPHPRFHEVGMGAGAAGASLTDSDIKAILKPRGYRLLDGGLSQELYAKWRGMGITRERLRAAVAEHTADDFADLSPGKLDVLFLDPRAKKAAGRRGRVAL